MRSRAAGLVLGYLADQAFGDPRRFHPVAGFGRVAGSLERRAHADSRARGAAYWAVLVGGTTALATVLEHRTRGTPLAHALVTGAATWTVLGARSLDQEAALVDGLLAVDLPAARERLRFLVGRSTQDLDEAEVVRAVVESVAENTSDAVVSSLVLGAALGVPGLLGHRAVNTLDAMVGHRTARYERFGWASARLDDVANLPGSRLTATLATLLGEDRAGARAAWRADAAQHPSPNAGPVEAAFAGALGITLGGRNVYDGRVEDRPSMGSGQTPVAADIRRARRLARRVDLAALAVAVAIALRPGGRPPGRCR
ncbi:MAG: adenosylcobinamide-phosphate synthase CbiB [Marmoricola sp.]